MIRYTSAHPPAKFSQKRRKIFRAPADIDIVYAQLFVCSSVLYWFLLYTPLHYYAPFLPQRSATKALKYPTFRDTEGKQTCFRNFLIFITFVHSWCERKYRRKNSVFGVKKTKKSGCVFMDLAERRLEGFEDMMSQDNAKKRMKTPCMSTSVKTNENGLCFGRSKKHERGVFFFSFAWGKRFFVSNCDETCLKKMFSRTTKHASWEFRRLGLLDVIPICLL